VGPLSQMMMDNGDMIQEMIDTIGPAAVAEFFINAGAGIAAAFDVTDLNPGNVPFLGGESQE
jgi:hypothetical protein